MAFYRTDRDQGNYTVIGNYHLRDRNLSLKAKGLLSFMLSLPDTWQFSIRGLTAVSKESIDDVRTGVQESERAHYVRRSKAGYDIYEQPWDLMEQ